MSLNRPARYTGDEIGNNLISTVWAWQMRLESRGRNETEMNEIEIAQIASVTIEQAHVGK